jgi:hypothetical protein
MPEADVVMSSVIYFRLRPPSRFSRYPFVPFMDIM